jgi:hypothetical protein
MMDGVGRIINKSSIDCNDLIIQASCFVIIRKIVFLSALITTVVYWDLYHRKESWLKKHVKWLNISSGKSREKVLEELKFEEEKKLEEQKRLDEKKKIEEHVRLEKKRRIIQGLKKIASLSEFPTVDLEFSEGPCLTTSKSMETIEWLHAKLTIKEKEFNKISANSLTLIYCTINKAIATQDISALKCTFDKITANDVFVQSSKIYAFITSENNIKAYNCDFLGRVTAKKSITVINCESVRSIYCEKECNIRNINVQRNIYCGDTPSIKCTRIEGTLRCPTKTTNERSPSILCLENVEADTVILDLPHFAWDSKQQQLILSASKVKKVVFKGEDGIVILKDLDSQVEEIYGGKLRIL